MPIWHSSRSGSLSTRCMGNEIRGTANHFPTESAGGSEWTVVSPANRGTRFDSYEMYGSNDAHCLDWESRATGVRASRIAAGA